MKNYYKILEIDSNASKEIIDKAYRVLAKKYHPDANPADKKAWAEDNFKKINEAYEILSNPERRAKYNQELEKETYQNNMSQDLLNKLQVENENLKRTLNNINTNTSTSNSSNYNTNDYNDIFENNSNNQKANYNYYKPNSEYNKKKYYENQKLLNRILNTELKKTIFSVIITIIIFEIILRFAIANPFLKTILLTHYYKNGPFKYLIYIFNILLFSPLNLK